MTEPTRRALAAGQVSCEQAVVVASAINQQSPAIDPARVQAAQVDLLDHSSRLSFQQARLVANHLIEAVDPDRADQILEQQLEDQEKRARAAAIFVG